MRYSGTNPNHAFSLHWDVCKPLNDERADAEIEAIVLDSQWNDAARQEFTTTVRFSLQGIPCRPASVTLRSAPRFLYMVRVPAVSARRR